MRAGMGESGRARRAAAAVGVLRVPRRHRGVVHGDVEEREVPRISGLENPRVSIRFSIRSTQRYAGGPAVQ